MKRKIYYIYKYILIILILIFESKKGLCKEYINIKSNKFTLDTFEKDGSLIKRYDLNFNLTTYLFNEYDILFNLANIQYAIICSEEDIDKKENEKTIILIWNTSTYSMFRASSIYLNAFPVWYYQQKEKGHTFCIRIDSMGWNDNAYAKICDDNDKSVPCPDLILLSTSQLTYRYMKGEIISLNKYFKKYFEKTGKSFESLLTKYSHYDYFVDNNWLGVPQTADFRIMRFNITTFDYCRKKGYDIHYPPPMSNYWGKNYQKTWTWEKAFEYSKMITECTGYPGFKLLNNYSEDLRFFATLCQALNIPFFTEDSNNKIKKCGLRNPDYIKKLTILKDLTENHYIETWLNETEVEKWQNSPYPTSIKDFKKIPLNETSMLDERFVNGLLYTTLFMVEEYPNIKLSYIPGTASYLGGNGIVITTKSKFHDEVFQFIEILIDKDYPVFVELNVSVTPFDGINGRRCTNTKKVKKERCNMLLRSDGVYPYYYINKNNITNIIYLNHLLVESDRGISLANIEGLNSNNELTLKNKLQNKKFRCDNEANYIKNTLTFYDEFEIEIPISEKENLRLRSMLDINTVSVEQTGDMKCSIYNDIVKIAKPLEFPYNNFFELTALEERNPVSLLFAHLYYGHNNTGTFEEVINEFCDIVDDTLIPLCRYSKDIKFELKGCTNKIHKNLINYLNCKTIDGDGIQKSVQCNFITYSSIKGYIAILFSLSITVVEIILIILTIIHRKEKCINIAGFKFLIVLMLTNLVTTLSSFIWIGNVDKIKCILRVWFMILSITCFICSYTIKSIIIISVFNNRKLTNTNRKKNFFLGYILIIFLQILLLTIWTMTNHEYDYKEKKIPNVGIYYDKECPIGNKNLLYTIFAINYILLIFSIFVSYQGRLIPDEFNDSRNIFISSLLTIFQLIICNITIIYVIENLFVRIFVLVIIELISLINIIIFISPKLMMIYNVTLDSISSRGTSIIVRPSRAGEALSVTEYNP